MDHGPAVVHEHDYASGYKTRLGLILFAVYGAIYAGFVFINAIVPQLMEKTVLFGINLAVTYGYGLILMAIVMGLIYNRLCTKKENELKAAREDENNQGDDK